MSCASKGRHYASASWGYFPYFLESLESSDVHVEELFIAYYPDGSRAGEFASEVEALRFLYREACARLDLIALKLEHPLVKNMARLRSAAVAACEAEFTSERLAAMNELRAVLDETVTSDVARVWGRWRRPPLEKT